MAKYSSSVAAQLSCIKGKDYLSSSDLNTQQTEALLELSSQLKKGERRIDLGNRVLGLIFKKASTRTRVSFQVAMTRLGGQSVDLDPKQTQVGRGESLEDTARVLSRFCDVLAIRTYEQKELTDYAKWSSIPIINALTDLEHPCQALADYLTLKENFGDLENTTLAYVGDGNNVANSLMICGSLLGVKVIVASPKGFEPNIEIIKKANSVSKTNSVIKITNNPKEAVKSAQAIYTDVWSSMGQEEEQLERSKAFKDFCVNHELMQHADPNAIVLHCLPAHRGEEISNDILEGASSKVFDQAENRLHVQQALLSALLGGL